MENIKDFDELAMCMDITSRMAIFAMAKAMNTGEIAMSFDEMNKTLTGEGGYDVDKLAPLIDMYKKATIAISDALD